MRSSCMRIEAPRPTDAQMSREITGADMGLQAWALQNVNASAADST